MNHGSRAGSRSRYGLVLALALLLPASAHAGPYVTPTSGIRWNDVGGIRWNDVGGIRWNDVGGIRWNDVGGIRWNDVGGFASDATGIRWNDVGGIRWNDVGSLVFEPVNQAGATLDLDLIRTLAFLPDSSAVEVVVSYVDPPTQADLTRLVLLGILGGETFHKLPMVVVNATKEQIRGIAALTNVRSVFSNKTLSILDSESGALIGAQELASDPSLRLPNGQAVTGAGVTIAVLDTGVDATHPDLPYGSKVVGNVRLTGMLSSGPGFVYAPPIEGTIDTDPVLGHGTAVASVAAGTGSASAGAYAGVAPGAKILGLSAGDLLIVDMLEGFDYILDNAGRLGVRVVNCSWGTSGWFDPEDPVNIATRRLYDSGIAVVFAAGNNGPAPDTLNPYSVAAWVVGVGATRKDGTLSDFSSRGIYEELLYHPRLVAPGESIVTARTGALGGDPIDPPANLYTLSSGTSFAAPHVAGVIALMLEAAPALTPAEIGRILQKTATPVLTRDRSEVGAGRLDAWAAVAQSLDASRPFGSHVAGWLDERPFRIDHQEALESSYTLPAGGSLLLPANIDGTESAWSLGLAWGDFPGLADLDVRLLDKTGVEVARSDSLSAGGLFGRVEGLHLVGDVRPDLTIEVSFKQGTGTSDQDFYLTQERASAVLTSYTDVSELEPAELDFVTRAVSRGLIAGRGDEFAPWASLTRGELARSLALSAAAPQRVPALASFADVPPGDAQFPYVESVAGSRARSVLLAPPAAAPVSRLQARAALRAFRPSQAVRRLDFAVALVRAAGMEADAVKRAGEPLPLADRRKIPRALGGYVAVALEHGLLDAVQLDDRSYFDPEGPVSRLDASRRLLTLLGLLPK